MLLVIHPFIFLEEAYMKDSKLILWFDDIELKDIPQVGGKNASLGEMRRELISKGVNIPDGFAVTAHAYRYLVESAGIAGKIRDILSDLDTHDIQNLSEKGRRCTLHCEAKVGDTMVLDGQAIVMVPARPKEEVAA